jgi:hypothetical protein
VDNAIYDLRFQDYNFPVNDASGDRIAMSNLLAYKNVAAIYIPGGNYTYLGSSTQTFLDFDSVSLKTGSKLQGGPKMSPPNPDRAWKLVDM